MSVPQRQLAQDFTIPAPRTINAVAGLASMTPNDCIYTYNLMPGETDMQTRKGFELWKHSYPSNIRTVLPFIGDLENQNNDKLFVCTEDGIYDATTQGAAGFPDFNWATTGGVAGYGVYTHYTNDAGDHFVMLADELNGLHEYEESTGLWTATAGITGPTTTDIIFVMAHQRRLWLIEEDSSDAWYLPVGAKAGAATKFNFGSQFREGGNLVGLYSWTVDGGDGVDDYLVGVSREGGIVIYRGTDPANASTWALVGVWYIGRVPVGHRVASQYGGELFVLSENGLISINKLLQGASVSEAALASTDLITRLVRANIADTLEQRGWELRIIPDENQYVINTPLSTVANHISYVRNLTTSGWGMWRGLPMATGDVFQRKLYFADNNGELWVYDGEEDNRRVLGINDNFGDPIEFSMLTAFQGDGKSKIGHHCRVHFVANETPAFAVQARWDFDFDETSGNLGASSGLLGATWDAGIWDSSLWTASASGKKAMRGISGDGQFMAIALRGKASKRLRLIAMTVAATSGWLL